MKFLHETRLSLFLQFVVLKMEKQDGTGEFDSDRDVNIYIINDPKPQAHFIFTNDDGATGCLMLERTDLNLSPDILSFKALYKDSYETSQTFCFITQCNQNV